MAHALWLPEFATCRRTRSASTKILCVCTTRVASAETANVPTCHETATVQTVRIAMFAPELNVRKWQMCVSPQQGHALSRMGNVASKRSPEAVMTETRAPKWIPAQAGFASAPPSAARHVPRCAVVLSFKYSAPAPVAPANAMSQWSIRCSAQTVVWTVRALLLVVLPLVCPTHSTRQ